MANDEIFSGKFRIAYLVTKTLALYAGTYLLCFFWPLFLTGILAPPVNTQAEALAGVLLAPLGFLILGIAMGLAAAITHVVLLAVAAGLAYAFFPASASDPLRELLVIWTPLLIGAYALGMGAGVRRQLQRF